MTGGPLGNTVIIPTGPCLYFSIKAGDFICLWVPKGEI